MRPAVAALLYTAPRRLRDGVRVDHFVHHDGPGVDLFGKPFPAVDVAGEDARRQTVNTVVRQTNGFLIGLESHDR